MLSLAFALSLSLFADLSLANQHPPSHLEARHLNKKGEADGPELSERDLGLAPLPEAVALVERQSVGTGGVSASTGNISAGVGDISLSVGNITIHTGDLTLEDLVLGNIVVIVDVGVGAPANASNSTSNSTVSDTGGQATTILTNGEEEVEIVTVVSDPSTFYTFSTECCTTTIAEISSTHIELDDEVVPTIRPREVDHAPHPSVTPAPAPLGERQVSVDPSISVGGVSASVGEIGASVGNINVTVGDVLVGLGDITLKNITIGNVFVSVNIQANLKRSDGSPEPTNGVRVVRAEPRPTPPPAAKRADVAQEKVMDGLHVEGRREIKAR